jgi:hypothetical protein
VIIVHATGRDQTIREALAYCVICPLQIRNISVGSILYPFKFLKFCSQSYKLKKGATVVKKFYSVVEWLLDNFIQPVTSYD